MAKRVGRTEAAARNYLISACRGRYFDFYLQTADIARGVFGTPIVTKSQRVSILRIMRRIQNDVLDGSGGWFVSQSHGNRKWLFVADTSAGASSAEPDPERMQRRPGSRIAAAIRLLASDHEGERHAALGAASRLLTARDFTWGDVADAVSEWG